MREEKRVKVKPHPLSKFLKDKCVELHESLRLATSHLLFEEKRMNHYKQSLEIELTAGRYADAKHTDFCLKKAKIRVKRWQKLVDSLKSEIRGYELDLYEFRRLRHYFKQDITLLMGGGDNDRYELFVKSKRHQQLLDKYPEAKNYD